MNHGASFQWKLAIPGTPSETPAVKPSQRESLESEPWPATGLERVRACPVCGRKDRALLHEGLADRIFFCAPGRWMMYRCGQCRSAFLDPRPTEEAIALAYRNYYTHEASPTDLGPPRSLSQWWKQSRRNDFLRSGFGYRRGPILPGGRFLLSSRRRRKTERLIRHLPSPASSGARLLDVGCGNGSFLEQMRLLGWAVVGLEPDIFSK